MAKQGSVGVSGLKSEPYPTEDTSLQLEALATLESTYKEQTRTSVKEEKSRDV